MGVFNSIMADIPCAVTGTVSKNTEIQIKWQYAPWMNHYAVGDVLEDLEPGYDNAWVRTDYICEACSKHTAGKFGEFIGVEDQRWHRAFVRLEQGKICQILSELEFAKLGIGPFVDDSWDGFYGDQISSKS